MSRAAAGSRRGNISRGGALSRQSVADSSSIVARRKMLDFKGAQTSDIMPVFHLHKAKPIASSQSLAQVRLFTSLRSSKTHLADPSHSIHLAHPLASP